MVWNLWRTVNVGKPESALTPKLVPAG
jgi:hypothetical protein